MESNVLNFTNVEPLLVDTWRSGPTVVSRWSIPHFGFLAIAVLGTVSNLLICTVFMVQRTFRTPHNVYIANLSMGNLAMSVLLMPGIFLPQTYRHWSWGETWCKAINSITGMNVYSSTFSIIAIAADQSRTVRQYRRDGGQRTKRFRHSFLICFLIWIIAAAFVTPLIHYHTTSDVYMLTKTVEDTLNISLVGVPSNTTKFTVGQQCVLITSREIALTITISQVLFLLPVPLSVVCYFNYKLHGFLKEREQRLLVHVQATNNLSDRLSHEHRRISMLLVAMVMSMAVTWMPFHATTVVNDLFIDRVHDKFALQRWDIFCQLLGHTSLVTNPLIYGFLNSVFLEAVRELPQSISGKVEKHRKINLNASAGSLVSKRIKRYETDI